jgi:hypothetical protein
MYSVQDYSTLKINSSYFEKLLSTFALPQYRNSFGHITVGLEGLRPQEVPQEVAQTYQEPINQAPSAQNFQNLDQNQVNQAFAGMIDENGYLDGNKLMNTLQTLDQRAKQAEETAKKVQEQARQEQINKRDREEKAAIAEVYTKFPQMDPNNVDGVEVEGELVKFDPKMWQYVKNELEATARRGVMPSESDYMNTTQKVYNDLYGERQMNKKVEAKKIENQKLQINATRPRSTINVGYYENDEEDSIVKDVRAGKRGAVGALLRKRGL